MKIIRGRERSSSGVNAGAFLRAALLVGVCMGIICAKPEPPEYSMSSSDVLNLFEKQSQRGGSSNRDASVDYLRYSGGVRLTCKRRGLCNCYSKVVRRSFCCDCLNGPCFPADALVTTPHGNMAMANLATGDLVLAGSASGGVMWSPVVAWLDRRPYEEGQYLSIATEGGPSLTLSSSHLLFTSEGHQLLSKFAGDVSEEESLLMITNNQFPNKIDSKEGGHLSLTTSSGGHLSLTTSSGGHLSLTTSGGGHTVASTNITNIKPVIKKGAYVPLTEAGTIFVNGILASCYASVTHEIAHSALAPVRWLPSWMIGGEYEGTMPFVLALKWIAARVLPFRYLAPRDTSVIVDRSDEFMDKEGLSIPHFLNCFSSVFHMFVISV